PLVLWLWLTGRRSAAIRAAVGALALTLVPWSLIGFRGLASYPDLLSAFASVGTRNGLFAQALAARAGGGQALCTVGGFALAATLVGISYLRRDDHVAYTLMLIAGLASSPIVWIFYLGLVAVAIGARESKYA